ncbi:hypothetical protein GCM10007972_10530 [Iodidimonas muriae]|uniref:DUF2336 domain-containing protein n=1 Tax=Iodidimonas muriae TaxID=261467 RepID=A0ABQ2LBF8_9PROT|nr:DUF2336 domain-containing protein [Iodidimonas muriae]GER08000.1 hypothetical protein JCM17843_23100 [Kordiimonadales bacterium JCM 17843]GGO09214.1 hypothetical protein GCM10007972_10530 [Iodidimonas muriae]
MDYKGLMLPSSSNRAQLEKVVLARKVGLFLVDDHDDDERRVVLDVAQTLARDLSVEVRQTLAFELRRANSLPFGLADLIARDIEEISTPFLMQTTVFSDEELAVLARELSESAKIAIVRRSRVPDVVALAIAQTGGERSVTFLIRNPGAELGSACDPLMQRFETNKAMMDQLSKRGDLPLEIVERLINHVSDACRVVLVERYELDPALAGSLNESVKNIALLRWMEDASRGALNEYIRQLESRGAVNARFLADLTRRGGIRFFESVMSYKTGIEISAIEAVIRSDSKAHLIKLLKKAGFKEGAAGRLLAALDEGRHVTLSSETDAD